MRPRPIPIRCQEREISCPHCNAGVTLNQLPHQGCWSNFRVCPHCGGLFTPDSDTKIRQAFCMVLSAISLVFTLLLYYESNNWLEPALSSYIVLGGLIYWGNRKMYLVPYSTKRKARK